MKEDTNVNYPNVLIINSQSMLEDNATGITLRSLWGAWPKDKLLEIYEDEKKSVENTLLLSRKKMPDDDFLLKKVMRGVIGNRINSSFKKNTLQVQNTKKIPFKSKLRQAFVCLWNMSPVKIDNDTLRAIEEFSPDVIYTLGSTVTVLNLCKKVAKKRNISVVVHYMDNWPEYLQWDSNPLLFFYKHKLKLSLKRVLKRSKVGICISESMADRYSSVFGIRHSVLMNSVNIDNCIIRAKQYSEKKVFVYAGGLHLNRWMALKEIAECLMYDNGFLKIYTSDENRNNYEKFFVGLPVEFCELVNHEHINEIYEKADILVHAETNDPLMHGFFKYSISTKIPEYLATGKPVLFYGPKDLGLYSYLSDNRVAVCASNISELKYLIKKVCMNEIDYDMSNRALMLVKKNHNINIAREVLRTTMIDGI